MASPWTKETAAKELETLAEETRALAELRRRSEEHTRWLVRTRKFLEDVFGENSLFFKTFTGFTWNRQGQFVVGGVEHPEESRDPELGLERINQEAYVRQLESARGLLLAAKDELERKDLSEVYKGKDTGPEASLLLKIIRLGEFKLRKAIRAKPESEKEVQDAFETLLVGADVPYSREAENIEYSSKTYRPDFTIPKSDLAIDVKLCYKGEREKEIIAEINDDILAYQTKYGNLLFIIYDLGFIRDIDRFKDNFEEMEGVIVRVVKH